jgi:hypothetical protein
LDILQVKEALKAFDPGLADAIALGVARYLLSDEETLTVTQFAAILELEDEEYIDSVDAKTFDPGLLGRVRLFLN